MRVIGLIIIWIIMTLMMIFRFAKIEDQRTFIILYLILTIYLACLIWQYRRGTECDE